jgi:hypothetical protein
MLEHFTPVTLESYGDLGNLMLDLSVIDFPVIENETWIDVYADARLYFDTSSVKPEFSH